MPGETGPPSLGGFDVDQHVANGDDRRHQRPFDRVPDGVPFQHRDLRIDFQVQIDETGKTYPAKFSRIGARVDPSSQSIKVAAAIDGKFPELMAGMSGRVQVKPP